MNAVMISIKPRWCEMIARGAKAIEVRKTRPKINMPFKCYIYCTKGKKNDPHELLEIHDSSGNIHKANGKVIGDLCVEGLYHMRRTLALIIKKCAQA